MPNWNAIPNYNSTLIEECNDINLLESVMRDVDPSYDYGPRQGIERIRAYRNHFRTLRIQYETMQGRAASAERQKHTAAPVHDITAIWAGFGRFDQARAIFRDKIEFLDTYLFLIGRLHEKADLIARIDNMKPPPSGSDLSKYRNEFSEIGKVVQNFVSWCSQPPDRRLQQIALATATKVAKLEDEVEALKMRLINSIGDTDHPEVKK